MFHMDYSLIKDRDRYPSGGKRKKTKRGGELARFSHCETLFSFASIQSLKSLHISKRGEGRYRYPDITGNATGTREKSLRIVEFS